MNSSSDRRLSLEQTIAVWSAFAGARSCFVQEVFAGNTSESHFRNCRRLITKGLLEPEEEDGLAPYQRKWDSSKRYRLTV